MIYHFPVMLNLGKVSSEIARVQKLVNDELAMFGVAGKLILESEVGTISVSVDCELTRKELVSMSEMVTKNIAENTALSDLGICLGHVRRKSGKSSNQSTVEK